MFVLQLSEKYGPVYTIHMGMETVVVLCSYDVVKEALIDNADDFGARGHMPLLDRISSGGHGKNQLKSCNYSFHSSFFRQVMRHKRVHLSAENRIIYY